MDKLKIWQQGTSWEDAEKKWDAESLRLKQTQPIKTLGTLPKMPGMTRKPRKGVEMEKHQISAYP